MYTNEHQHNEGERRAIVIGKYLVNERSRKHRRHKSHRRCQNRNYYRYNEYGRLGLEVLHESAEEPSLLHTVNAGRTGRGERSSALGADGEHLLVDRAHHIERRLYVSTVSDILDVVHEGIAECGYREGKSEHVDVFLFLTGNTHHRVTVHTLVVYLLDIAKSVSRGTFFICKTVGKEMTCCCEKHRLCILSFS